MKRWLLLVGVWAFLAIFLLYPLFRVAGDAFVVQGSDGVVFTLEYFRLVFANELYRLCFANSLVIGLGATAGALIIALPLVMLFRRIDFPCRRPLEVALLAPIILPPFVGAIGIKHFFARFGSINLLLGEWGLISLKDPPDWFGDGGLGGVILMQALHLFPILYLGLSAAVANVDPSLREAAAGLGAGPWRTFRTVTLPLLAPGVFAGCSIVFVSAFTDLGTPLIFDCNATVPTQIFLASSEASSSPVASALVMLTLVAVMVLFFAGRAWGEAGSCEMSGRAGGAVAMTRWRGLGGWLVTAAVCALLGVALLPHAGVALNSIAGKWFFTAFPTELTGAFYAEVFRDELTVSSVRNSLVYSLCSAGLDMVLGVAIAWLLARGRIPGRVALDAVVMMPLALPGLVLAFGYLVSFNVDVPWLNPRTNPTLLLVVSYAVRRLPFIVRAAYAGFRQLSPSFEEASMNLGASPRKTLIKITLPLIAANLVAGGILVFSFAMLEVSDSLILAMELRFAPITKGIYELVGRPQPEAAAVACALGVLAMGLLAAGLCAASRLMGRSLGELFRA
ncbi:MAG TPA: iron ABC transporter permease [Verrucomicrobiae bacterium]|nr:iron ABC transporter permease [Verrucomicrobiae bacterium]